MIVETHVFTPHRFRPDRYHRPVWYVFTGTGYGGTAPPDMAQIPAGCFDMGEHFGEGGGDGLIPPMQLSNSTYLPTFKLCRNERRG